MNYAHNRAEDEHLIYICEVCEGDASASVIDKNLDEWGVACCDECVEGGLECGALPLGGE